MIFSRTMVTSTGLSAGAAHRRVSTNGCVKGVCQFLFEESLQCKMIGGNTFWDFTFNGLSVLTIKAPRTAIQLKRLC